MTPTLCILGGCNGAGKTTLARKLLPRLGLMRFLNADEIARGLPGVAHTFAITGYSSVLQANQSNVGAAFIIPDSFDKRTDPSLHVTAIMANLRKATASIKN